MKDPVPGDGGTNALLLLRRDHEKVRGLFAAFEERRAAGALEDRAALAEEICRELTVHTALEELVFYPAVAKVMDNRDAVREALVEHRTAKQLILRIARMRPGEPLFDATVRVLSEYVRHHVDEEHNTLFPQIDPGRIDLDALGAELQRRRDGFLAEAGTRGITGILTRDEDQGWAG